MLLWRILVTFGFEHCQRLDQLLARVARLDNGIHKSALGHDIGIREALAKFFDLFASHLVAIRRGIEFPLVYDVDRALGSHHRDLRGRPRIIHISTDVLGRHHAIRSAIGFACDDGNFRYGRFGKCEKQLCSMLDDAAIFLRGAGKKSRNVFKRHQRDVEAVAEADEAGALHGCVNIKRASQHGRLIGDDSHAASIQPRKSHDDVLRVVLLHFEEISVIDDGVDHIFDVIGQIRLRRHDLVERRVGAINGIGAGLARRIVEIIRGHKTQQFSHHREALGVIVSQKVRHSRSLVVRHRSPQLLFRNFFVGDRLDHVGTRNEHVGGFVYHQDKIGNRRRVNCPTGTRPHDGRDLRHDSAVQSVTQKDIGVAGQRHHTFLNASSTGVIQSNQRRAHLRRQIHNLDDFSRICLGKRSAKHREILRENVNEPPFDASVTGHESVAINLLFGHAEIVRAVRDQFVRLLERAFIEQELDALACRHLAFLVLALAPLHTPAIFCELIAPLEFGDFFFQVHGQDYSGLADMRGCATLLSMSLADQMGFNFRAPERRVWKVRDLVAAVRTHIEREYSDAWVEGEISNFRAPESGHLYFTLKDGNAQIRVVMFRSSARLLRFRPADGLQVIVRGRITIYEDRGELQISGEYMEPKGAGSLQLAFEQLKTKLQGEGLFAAERKKPLPSLPSRIGIVTSTQAAALRDILNILERRHHSANVLIYPAQVQGDPASLEVAAGVRYFSRQRSVDVIIVARGGGSAEDLAPFNDEGLARTVAASEIPVISAIGHETDFTIIDFVADLRAPTPSAAAELVIRSRQEIETQAASLEERLARAMRYRLLMGRQALTELAQHGAFARMMEVIHQREQRLDDLTHRMETAQRQSIDRLRRRFETISSAVRHYDLRLVLSGTRRELESWTAALVAVMRNVLLQHRVRSERLQTALESLSPLAILDRGYALIFDSEGKLLKSASQVQVGDPISARLAHGSLDASVTKKKD